MPLEIFCATHLVFMTVKLIGNGDMRRGMSPVKDASASQLTKSFMAVFLCTFGILWECGIILGPYSETFVLSL